ncbi:GMC oxidoreductase [Actibacterium lipolyticum]|uniref:Alcohol dehydrogenase [acceptor] n=1 Tax=Actibacterium lipolyticum TaxID=1524263 RepID=A0A238L870_9RHOB|nr:GMC oxidoreductase [Actibacterium lipolyticum]SMX51189.1 Alcohol dehydrogenase [acceptor] [Actibacterium lipolyticum]
MFAKTDPALPGADMQPLFVHEPYYAETQEPVTPNAFTFLAAGVHPTSRGQITLNSADPEDEMNIDPNLLAEQYDVGTLVASIKQMHDIASQSALNHIRDREIYRGPQVQSDEDLASYVRSAVLSYHHQNDTCKMGVDASVFPFVMGGNTNAPAIMVAEKAAAAQKHCNQLGGIFGDRKLVNFGKVLHKIDYKLLISATNSVIAPPNPTQLFLSVARLG